MHSIVTRLEENGLLERSPHPNHGRIQQLHLTDEGQVRLDRGHEIVEEIEEMMTETVQKEEVEQAKRVLIQCAQALWGE